ncbi:hypothetical protein V8D89_000282 [Ganoderma adspersum]
MRLLDTETGQFIDKDPKNTEYAILSHTWDTEKGEQTYDQLRKIQQRYDPGPQNPQSRPKITEVDGTSHKLVRGLPTAVGHLTQSEVKDLFRAFGEAYGLVIPNPASAVSDPSALDPDPQSKPLPQCIWDDPELSPKIREACRVAREKGYRYIWIDSCCIDKSSSSELSEAINSMYKWYGLADVCYAYLADVPPGEDHQAWGSAFRKSRWFGRGWTLQELIAPLSVEFLSKDWAPIGSKHALVDVVESVTKIDYKALLHMEPLDAFSVAQRLSWAASRETTREEDRAYSLLGILDINMATLYGEGDRAFRRLQEQIMQRTPDQSLFAWGRIYLGSQLSRDPDLTETPKAHRATQRTMSKQRHLFATSPDKFKGCEGIRTSRRDTGQLLSSHGHRIAYTPTPYGMSTQLWMVPLTQDLLLRAIPHSAEDLQLDVTLDSSKGSQWHLVILRCELKQRQGHCLGRVCYLTPSEESDVNFVYTGSIGVHSQHERLDYYELFLLSPATIEHCRPRIKLKTVYIPHPDSANLPVHLSVRRQPYTAIKLVLLRATRDALRSRGYSADLRDLGDTPDQPATTHLLTLSSKDELEHTITVKFQHTLRKHGRRLTINAEVKMSLAGSPRAQLLDSTPSDLDQAEPRSHSVSWSDINWSSLKPWDTKLDRRSVRLSAPGPGAGTLTVDLGLDFGGCGYYYLRVDVLSDRDTLPASSGIVPDVDQGEEGECTEEGSSSPGANDPEDGGLEDIEETDGHQTAPSEEARDTVATSNDTDSEGGDVHGALD